MRIAMLVVGVVLVGSPSACLPRLPDLL